MGAWIEGLLIGILTGTVPTVIVSVFLHKRSDAKLKTIIRHLGIDDPDDFTKEVDELKKTQREVEKKAIIATLSAKYNLAPEVVEKLGLAEEEKGV